ncbi:MAG: bifunctional hydroxymethylpyrimidine kinase/phosphomethylpyrimidine kinase [Pontixanthobacter sp.]
MMRNPPRILSIAGSDSSGGAGIQADVKTIAMLGGYGMTAITAITAQNTLGVHAAQTLSPDLVAQQIDACVRDIGIDAVKIGMLGSADIATRVADMLIPLEVPIVFDPVMVATSGAELADRATIEAFERLMELATLTTPNQAELVALGGDAAMEQRKIASLVKGGDAQDDMATDRLVQPGAEPIEWSDPKIDTRHSHGTGCTLSSAIATFLGFGASLPDAIARARVFVRLALQDAPGFGEKAGPLGHHAIRLDMTGEPRLNQVTLPSHDYEKSVRFYRAIGLKQIVDSPTNGYARFECAGGATLSISCNHTATGQAAIYFECWNVTAFAEKLRAAGVDCPAPQDESWNWRESWIADPSGNRICFYEAGEDRRYPPWRIE